MKPPAPSRRRLARLAPPQHHLQRSSPRQISSPARCTSMSTMGITIGQDRSIARATKRSGRVRRRSSSWPRHSHLAAAARPEPAPAARAQRDSPPEERRQRPATAAHGSSRRERWTAIEECEAESAAFDCPASQATYGPIEDWDVGAVTSLNNWGAGCTEDAERKCGRASAICFDVA